jgi:glyoxylase-like metal-dependent hydrolase (beta-lactamase superfamily II)/rhodanese-related sulfurtransferase
MIFRELNDSKCKTYLLASGPGCKAVIVDPVRERTDRYLAWAAYQGLKIGLVVDTHTHADHRSGARELNHLTGAPLAMHRLAPQPGVAIHVDDGERLALDGLELTVLHTPGHTPDSISLLAADRVLTGDTLLVHGTGRTDFAGGDPGTQYDAIVAKLFVLPDDTLVFPAHDYRGQDRSTIGEEKRNNPRLAGRSRQAYIDLMNNLGLPMPEGLQQVLQPNQCGIEPGILSFPALEQLQSVRQVGAREAFDLLSGGNPPVLLDIREAAEFRGDLGHIDGALHIPLREIAERAPAELAAHRDSDIIIVCRVGVRSTTAAAMLAGQGFNRVFNLEGGMLGWREAGLPVEH